MSKNLQQRWTSTEIEHVAALLHSGGKVCDVGPFGRHEGRIDLRGFKMLPPYTVEGVVLVDVDLSWADLSRLYVKRCHVENVLFVQATLDGLHDESNCFERCQFERASLVGVTMGLGGTRYRNCTFIKCKFAKAHGVRAEFERCRFTDNDLKGLDFEASSFEHCVFEGKVADAWFRGGYPYDGYEERFGKPKPNQMKNVSFAKADLELVSFSNHCNLSTVVLPENGEYRKYNQWSKRLVRLMNDLENWNEPDLTEGKFFLQVMMPHARTQDWMIVNLRDVRRHIAPHATERIIRSLDAPL